MRVFCTNCYSETFLKNDAAKDSFVCPACHQVSSTNLKWVFPINSLAVLRLVKASIRHNNLIIANKFLQLLDDKKLYCIDQEIYRCLNDLPNDIFETYYSVKIIFTPPFPNLKRSIIVDFEEAENFLIHGNVDPDLKEYNDYGFIPGDSVSYREWWINDQMQSQGYVDWENAPSIDPDDI